LHCIRLLRLVTSQTLPPLALSQPLRYHSFCVAIHDTSLNVAHLVHLFAVLVMMLMVLKRRIIVVGRHRRISWRCPPPAGSGGRSN